jgi:hypothetical protein
MKLLRLAMRRWTTAQNAHLPIRKLRFFADVRLALPALVTLQSRY